MTNSVSFTFHFTIRNLEKRSQIIGASLPDEKTKEVKTTTEDLGYVLTLEPGGISYILGPDEPPPEWKKGAKVRMELRLL